jgi:hypothetical protein
MMLYRWNMSSLLIAPARPVSRTNADRGPREDRIMRYFSALPPDQIPHVKATAKHLSGHNIDFGLDVIIDGFKVRLARLAAERAAAGAGLGGDGDAAGAQPAPGPLGPG